LQADRDNVLDVQCIIPHMPGSSPCRVRFVEMVREGLIITFGDGKCALFSADLLYASLPQAQELHENDEDDPDVSQLT
jgi:hypothetical protein